jgi:DNA polymerase-3 subunit alpha
MPRVKRGPVHLCLSHSSLPGEVEVDLQQEFPMTPEIKSAIKSLSGILTVEEM